jgi:hypothetical protein
MHRLGIVEYYTVAFCKGERRRSRDTFICYSTLGITVRSLTVAGLARLSVACTTTGSNEVRHLHPLYSYLRSAFFPFTLQHLDINHR